MTKFVYDERYAIANVYLDLSFLLRIMCKLMSESTEAGAVTQRILNWDLFNQNGMDFVTEISFCKTPVVDEKRLVFRG